MRAAVALLIASPTLARAAEGGAAGGGMPQLRFNEPLVIAQVVWLLILFGVLYYVMARYALPQVGQVIASRRDRIGADLAAAQSAKAAADAALAENHAATQRSRVEAQAAIAAALAEAQAAADARAEVLNARLAEQVAGAERRIDAARDTAMGALRQVAVETAEALVARLVGGAPDRGAIDRAVQGELLARGRA